MSQADETDENIALTVAEWRQGDFTLDIAGLLYADVPEPNSGEPLMAVYSEGGAKGLVAISQTCDIVRYSADTNSSDHFITVCALVEVQDPSHIIAGLRPSFAVIENSPRPAMVADLTRLMTISKRLLAKVARTDGFRSELGRQSFAQSIERNYGRFAFPDDFVTAIPALRKRVREKHDKDSEPGRVYRSVRQIRVRAAPAWNAPNVSIGLLIVLDDEARRTASLPEIAKEFSDQIKKIKLPPPYQWSDPAFFTGTLDDLTARDWLESQPLDLDFLTTRGTIAHT